MGLQGSLGGHNRPGFHHEILGHWTSERSGVR